jgi:glucokinase
LALTFNAKGGIFFAGSIMRTISEMNAINMLKDNFENHHSEAHNEILKNISINLINKEHTPLYGNLNYSVIRRLHE